MAQKKRGKKKSPTKKKVNAKKKVCEVFDVKKKGKREIIETCGELEKEDVKNKTQEYNQLLKNVLIGILLVLAFVAGFVFWVHHLNQINYKGVKFEKTNVGQLTFYKTTIPVYYKNKLKNYNFYLRTNPLKLFNVSFKGKIRLLKNMVVNVSSGLSCDGDGVIAVANIANLYRVIGVKVIKDLNASCDSKGRYIYLNIHKGNITRIIETSPACYQIEVNNCEILPATEKFMAETFVKINSILK